MAPDGNDDDDAGVDALQFAVVCTSELKANSRRRCPCAVPKKERSRSPALSYRYRIFVAGNTGGYRIK